MTVKDLIDILNTMDNNSTLKFGYIAVIDKDDDFIKLIGENGKVNEL